MRALRSRPEFRDRVPDARTIRAILKRSEPDESELWAFATADADEAALVLPAWGELLRARAPVTSLTVNEARWIARLLRVFDMPPIWALHYARRYIARSASPTFDLDEELALRRWEEQPTTNADPAIVLAGLRYETVRDAFDRTEGRREAAGEEGRP